MHLLRFPLWTQSELPFLLVSFLHPWISGKLTQKSISQVSRATGKGSGSDKQNMINMTNRRDTCSRRNFSSQRHRNVVECRLVVTVPTPSSQENIDLVSNTKCFIFNLQIITYLLSSTKYTLKFKFFW